jgi:hypothetical protein
MVPKKIPRPRKVPTNVTISEDVRAELERMADEQRVTLSALVDRTLYEMLRAKGRLKEPTPRKPGETV